MLAASVTHEDVSVFILFLVSLQNVMMLGMSFMVPLSTDACSVRARVITTLEVKATRSISI